MKKSVYQENVEKSIKRNIRLSNFDTEYEREEFLNNIKDFCDKVIVSIHKPYHSPKTRHGSGKS